jgi:hypothetical protein
MYICTSYIHQCLPLIQVSNILPHLKQFLWLCLLHSASCVCLSLAITINLISTARHHAYAPSPLSQYQHEATLPATSRDCLYELASSRPCNQILDNLCLQRWIRPYHWSMLTNPTLPTMRIFVSLTQKPRVVCGDGMCCHSLLNHKFRSSRGSL